MHLPAIVDIKAAEKHIRKIDKERTEFYHYYTGREWTDLQNYDLCINTTALSFEQAAKAIQDFAANMLGWEK